MFRITEDPSLGSLILCLAKNYKNDSIVSVDVDKVGVMAAYCDRGACVCGSLYRKAIYHHPRHSSTYFDGLNIGAVLGV